MLEPVESRIAEIARRAGLGEVPPKALLALACVAVAVVVWGAMRWLPSEPSGLESGSMSVGPVVAAESSSTVEVPARILVHVVGAVHRPGVYPLPSECRVIDAVEAAGGMLANAVPSALNMARTVGDGEQIYVPTEDEVAAGTPPAAAPGSTPASAESAQVDINSAGAAELETLPGVGPSTAAKIIADREANGPFATVDDLTRVSGIGPKKLESLRELACVR